MELATFQDPIYSLNIGLAGVGQSGAADEQALEYLARLPDRQEAGLGERRENGMLRDAVELGAIAVESSTHSFGLKTVSKPDIKATKTSGKQLMP